MHVVKTSVCISPIVVVIVHHTYFIINAVVIILVVITMYFGRIDAMIGCISHFQLAFVVGDGQHEAFRHHPVPL
eukprot:scaffold125513_cov44-Prasinocladus_malaysianus.AAC.2